MVAERMEDGQRGEILEIWIYFMLQIISTSLDKLSLLKAKTPISPHPWTTLFNFIEPFIWKNFKYPSFSETYIDILSFIFTYQWTANSCPYTFIS
jgi:hypothetical protein